MWDLWVIFAAIATAERNKREWCLIKLVLQKHRKENKQILKSQTTCFLYLVFVMFSPFFQILKRKKKENKVLHKQILGFHFQNCLGDYTDGYINYRSIMTHSVPFQWKLARKKKNKNKNCLPGTFYLLWFFSTSPGCSFVSAEYSHLYAGEQTAGCRSIILLIPIS